MSESWFKIGHRTLHEQRTGCTAIVFDAPARAAVEVRGGAPGTRETDLLGPGRPGLIDGILLSGGSAFGLRAAEGVMAYLAEQGYGFPAPAGPVPRVPAAIVYDLATGTNWSPDADDGYAAAAAAYANNQEMGQVGAGAGVTVAKLGGPPGVPSGLGISSVNRGSYRVTALVVVNALGDVVDPASGTYLARSVDPEGKGRSGREMAVEATGDQQPGNNTVIGAVLLSRPLDGDALSRCCIAAHDALARCIVPAHTIFDGDAFFAAAPDTASVGPRELLGIGCAVEQAVEQAITGLFRQNVRNDTLRD